MILSLLLTPQDYRSVQGKVFFFHLAIFLAGIIISYL